jgi:hypothetical protein
VTSSWLAPRFLSVGQLHSFALHQPLNLLALVRRDDSLVLVGDDRNWFVPHYALDFARLFFLRILPPRLYETGVILSLAARSIMSWPLDERLEPAAFNPRFHFESLDELLGPSGSGPGIVVSFQTKGEAETSPSVSSP